MLKNKKCCRVLNGYLKQSKKEGSMSKVHWSILVLTLTISSLFWGFIIWFSYARFIFATGNTGVGMIFAVFLGIIVSAIHALFMSVIENLRNRFVRITTSSHSFEIFEYLMLTFSCGWMGVVYDLFMFGIWIIRKFFRQAGESFDHLMGQ